MFLEYSTLEVLHCVGLAVCVACLLHLLTYWVALLRQPAVRVPVVQERAADSLVGLREGTGVCRAGTTCMKAKSANQDGHRNHNFRCLDIRDSRSSVHFVLLSVSG